MRKVIQHFCMLALCVGIFGWSSCGQTTFDEIDEIPRTQENNLFLIERSNIAYHFGQQRGFNWEPISVPSDVQILLLDNQYQAVDYYFLLKFNNWFKELKFNNGIMPIDQEENLDCDNFAMMYKSLMSVASYKSKSKNEPAVALISVNQVHEFGGIPSGGMHMLNLIFTTRGWYVFEPQSNEIIEFSKYPNQEHIFNIIL